MSDSTPATETGRPIYCTAECDVCRDYARELGVPLLRSTYPDVQAALASREERPGLDVERLIEDGRKWQAAEAEGHVVTFSDTGYGLTHPPSCRPDLIGCWHNQYLAALDAPDEDPGRYRMTRHKGHAEYAALTDTPEAET